MQTFSPHFRAQAAATDKAIYQARQRAPIAHALLDDILDVMIAFSKRLTPVESAELEKYAMPLAECGQIFNGVTYGDITPATDAMHRDRLRVIVGLAAGRA